MKFASSFCFMALVALAHAETYTVIDLGAGATAADVNSSGHVVGTTGENLAFYYFESVQGLGVFIPRSAGPDTFADSSQGIGINDADVVIATGRSSTAMLSAANRYRIAGSGVQYLPFYAPLAINNSGMVVGTYPAGSRLDFTSGVWDLNPELGDNDHARFVFYRPEVYAYARPTAISDTGYVVGSAAAQLPSTQGNPTQRPRPNYIRACLFLAGGEVEYIDRRDPGATPINELDPTVPSRPANHLSDARGVNAAGHVVGDMSLTRGDALKHAFRYSGLERGMEDLGTLGGATSTAAGINSQDQVVGTSTTADEAPHAFVWQGGVMTDLNTLLPAGSGWELTQANAINDRGEIVGGGYLGNVAHAFLLSPASLTPPPTIFVGPAGATLLPGQTYWLSVWAQGRGPLVYQWQRAGTNLPGATNAILYFESATAFDTGSYRVSVSNAVGKVMSATVDIVVLDPQLSAWNHLGQVGLTLEGAKGASYRIEFSTVVNVPSWAPLTTLTLTNRSQPYADVNSGSNPVRIYRAMRLP